jgi:uncharacterized membrane protein
MADEPVYLFLAVYDTEEAAREDFQDVKQLHRDHELGTYDAAVVAKSEHGWVHVDKYEKPTQHAVWTGIAAGAALGILFPPSVLFTAAVGGVGAGLIGHFWKGMSRKDVKELGELLDEGQAALLIVGEAVLETYIEKALSRATRHASLEVEMDRGVLKQAIADAAKELGQAQA